MPIFTSSSQSNYFSSYIDIKAISTPSNPNSGIGRIFHRSSDGKLCFKKSNGTVVDLEDAGSSGAPTDAQYVTLATNASLSAERVLAGSSPITITDGGAGSNVTVGFTSTAVKLDDLGTPDDNTDLNSSTTAHGLLRKLTGGTTNFLREDGTWAAPPGAGGGISDIASANDVTFTSLQDEDLMRYDDGGGEWVNGKLVNANVDAAAAIAYSKLNLATSIVNADISGSAAIATSKLADSANFLLSTLDNDLGAHYFDQTRIAAPSDPSANDGRFYVKQIDANNDGVFVVIKRNGAFVHVQIV